MHIVDGAAQERAKYAEIWSTVPEYRNFSPGLQNVERFLSIVKPKRGSSIIDIGCGEGVAGLDFAKRGFADWYLDITNAGLKDSVPRNRFFEMPLWSNDWPSPENIDDGSYDGLWLQFDYGFCCDVMEHIPPEYTMLVLDRIIEHCKVAYFQICNLPDAFGQRIGEPLHLTVQNFNWWKVRIATLGKIIDARDLCGNSLFVVTR